MFGLTPLGIVHTTLSLVALAAAVVAFVKHKEILPDSKAGRVYIIATLLTSLTALGIFQHGGFGKPHALAIITLLALGVAAAARLTTIFRGASRYVETVSYSATLLFHMIPGVTETVTRLPAGRPLVASPEDPRLQPVFGLLFVIFLVGAIAQVIRLRRPAARA